MMWFCPFAFSSLKEEQHWLRVAQRTLAQLPKHEWQPFIDWLRVRSDILEQYKQFPDQVLRLWQDSSARYAIPKEL